MMPLWTIAMPSCEMCGCALRSLGTPCVAHRVCAMPRSPCVGSASSASCSLRTLPTVRSRLMSPVPFSTATPRGVVAAVLEPARALDQDRDDVTLGYGTNDSAHDRSSH